MDAEIQRCNWKKEEVKKMFGAIIFWIVICVAAAVVVSYLAAKKFEAIANMKGYQGYFWWCFWLGVAGWLMIVALPDRGTATAADGNQLAKDELPEL
jgi:undecaprenyl pyrophosphate phosphatase UppP